MIVTQTVLLARDVIGLGVELAFDVQALIQRHERTFCELTSVMIVEFDIVDCPLLRFTRIERDAEGHVIPDVDDPTRPRTREIERALIGPLPAWWQPRLPGAFGVASLTHSDRVTS